jgi:hypothetical protein
LTLSPSYDCIDVGEYTDSLGAMNMVGNIGSFASSVVFYLLTLTGSGSVTYVAAVLNVIALACWLGKRRRRFSGRWGKCS